MIKEKSLGEVVCVVILENNQFLLEQRLDNDNYFRRWTFPGGKVEELDYKSGADYLTAASIRELAEETGLILDALERFTTFDASSRNGVRLRFHGLYVKSYHGIVQNKERGRRKLKWVAKDDAAEYIGDTEVDRNVLTDFLIYQGGQNENS